METTDRVNCHWLAPFLLVPAMLLGIAKPGLPQGTNTGGTLRGTVVDTETKGPASGADVVLAGTTHRTTTDADGSFLLAAVPAGTYTLEVTLAGYWPTVRKGVVVASAEEQALDLEMQRLVTLFEEVTVTPGAFTFMDKGTQTRQMMTREDIESVPQIGEDIFRAVNRLPGLASGDYSAHFSIRGGRHDETLILLDGLELYEPYHLKDFNEGAISIIGTETIGGVELMTGGFPAQYGNKRSGVFNLTSRTPASDRARYSAGASFWNARVSGEGSLWNGKGSWLVSARRGFVDLVFRLINQNDLPSPRYYDVFAKLQRTLGSSSIWKVNVLQARDTYTFDAPATTGFLDKLRTREQAHNSYGNSYVWSTLTSALGSRTTMQTLVSAGLVTRSRDGSEQFVDIDRPLYSLTNSRDYSILGARQDWSFRATDNALLSAGFDWRHFHNTDAFVSVVGPNPDDPSLDLAGFSRTTTTSFEKSGRRLSGYVSGRWRVAPPLTLELGGRYDRADYTGDSDFSPRASAAIEVGHGRTLRAGWGEYRQIQGLDEVAVLNDDTSFYPSELSEQWTAGFEQTFGPCALFRLEAYRKNGSSLRPNYSNWKNAPDAFLETNEDRLLVFPTTSKAKGIELYFSRDVGSRLSLKAGYALSRADETVERIVNVNSPDPLTYDLTHPRPQDQRHAFNLDFTYRGDPWSYSGAVAFHTGWPATLEAPVPVVSADGQPDTAFRPTKIYGSRLPPYLRIDFKATRRKGNWRFFVEVVNLTNHANVFGYDYYHTLDGAGNIVPARDPEKWFTILPSVGVTWSNGS